MPIELEGDINTGVNSICVLDMEGRVSQNGLLYADNPRVARPLHRCNLPPALRREAPSHH
eukprot:scaffold179037_cov37-Tisochrysis_lutea.AAC.4